MRYLRLTKRQGEYRRVELDVIFIQMFYQPKEYV